MKSISRHLLWLSVVSAGLLSGVPTVAQITNARLTGSVTDPSGAFVPDAELTATNTGTGLIQKATSTGGGTYAFTALPPGRYTVDISKPGFATDSEVNVVLTVGQSATLNVRLTTGDAQQTITVTGGADLINTTTAEIGQVITESQIKDMPLNTRDPSSLVYLSGGVTNETISQASSTQTQQSFSTQTGASAGGGRQGSTWYLLDGVPNMDTTTLLAAPFPNSDATQEFRVITNNFDARYGFAPSAVVNILTRSGTNQIHGGLFEFVRNYDLDAKDYFSGASNNLKKNQFGAFAGGPIIKNRLFLFGNFQATRQSLTATQNTANTPTSAMMAGDFSGVIDQNGNSIPLHGAPGQANPFTTINGKPNQINPGLFSSGAVALMKSIPLGQNPNSALVFFANPAQVTNYNEGTGRLDYTINNNQRTYLRFYIDQLNQPGRNTPGNILSGVQGQNGIYLNAAANHTWTLSPRLLNSVTGAYISYDMFTGTQVKDSSGKPVCLSQYIQVVDPPGQCYTNLTAANGSNYYGGAAGFSVFNAPPYQTNRRLWVLSDTATATLGKHTIAAGIDLLHRHYYEFNGYSVSPAVSFNGSYTGFVLSDFLLGYSTGVAQGSGEQGKTDTWMLGLYAQEQYKLRPNITLNAGLRWDPNFSPTVAGNRGTLFEPGAQSTRYPNAPAGMLFAGEQGVPSGLMPTTYGYFEPRVGIAWQVDSQMAVRAGFGLFTTPLEDAFYNRVWDSDPFSPSYSVVYSAGTPDPFDNPWSLYTPTGGKSPFPPFATASTVPPATATFGLSVPISATFAKNYKLGVTQSWNLSIERQVGQSVAVHLAYVGNQSYHQATTVDQNPGHYFGPTDPNNGLRATYPNFSGVIQVQDGATASYNSAQAGVEKRFSHNFQFQSNFTWSRTFDVGGSGDPTFESSVSDPYNIRHDYGPSSLNYPFVWVSNGIYNAPSLSGRNALLRQVFGGWQLSGIFTAMSGPPFTINGGNGNNNSYFNEGQDRADLVPGQGWEVRQGGKSQWLNRYFNPNAFTNNALGTPGNMRKYSIQEAPLQNLDTAILKNWHYRERYVLQFRWEMYNTLNHPSFGQPDSNPGDSNFGQITSQGAINPRVMQGALKLTF